MCPTLKGTKVHLLTNETWGLCSREPYWYAASNASHDPGFINLANSYKSAETAPK